MIRVIDNVIESIVFGLEQNDFRTSQRRVAEVKYLSELYNYRMLEHPVIFDTMYKILMFGYGKNSTNAHARSLLTPLQVGHQPPADTTRSMLRMTSSAFVSFPPCLRPAASFSTAERQARNSTTSYLFSRYAEHC